MAKSGVQIYATRQECIELIIALRRQTNYNLAKGLALAEKIEELAKRSLDGWKPPERKPISLAPQCPRHGVDMKYNEKTDEWDCPVPFCGHHEYEDDEPTGEGAQVYHQEVADRSKEASHGSSKSGKKHERIQHHSQDEGSFNAKRIPLDTKKARSH
jgi:hypothetical protein